MANRRNDADTFALGMWAGKIESELTALIADAPEPIAITLRALRTLITDAKDTGDLLTLDKLRGNFRDAEFDQGTLTDQAGAKTNFDTAVEKSGVKDK